MRRFDRALTREMVAMATSTFIALVAIVVVIVLVRVLGQAVLGEMEPSAVLPLLVFSVLRFLPALLSLALFIGVFMTLSRIWRESEAVIWMSAGVGPWGWVRPVLLFAMPIVVLIGFVSFSGLPWAAKKQAEYERKLASRDEIASLAPGRFTEYGEGERVHFVESISPDGEHVSNVFVQSELQGRTGIIVAKSGDIESTSQGERFLVLKVGRRYEGETGRADFRVGEFERYSVRIEPKFLEDITASPRMISVQGLMEDPTPRNMRELVSRIGYPVSAFLLALLAIPMSYVNPRAGKSLNVLFAILIYVAYNNFFGLSSQWVGRSELSPVVAVVAIHGGMLILVLGFFWQRFRGPWSR